MLVKMHLNKLWNICMFLSNLCFYRVCVCVCVQCYPAVRGRWGQLAGWSCSPQSERAQEETGEGPALESTGERERQHLPFLWTVLLTSILSWGSPELNLVFQLKCVTLFFLCIIVHKKQNKSVRLCCARPRNSLTHNPCKTTCDFYISGFLIALNRQNI